MHWNGIRLARAGIISVKCICNKKTTGSCPWFGKSKGYNLKLIFKHYSIQGVDDSI
jgi:hypothetical protein